GRSSLRRLPTPGEQRAEVLRDGGPDRVPARGGPLRVRRLRLAGPPERRLHVGRGLAAHREVPRELLELLVTLALGGSGGLLRAGEDPLAAPTVLRRALELREAPLEVGVPRTLREELSEDLDGALRAALPRVQLAERAGVDPGGARGGAGGRPFALLRGLGGGGLRDGLPVRRGPFLRTEAIT